MVDCTHANIPNVNLSAFDIVAFYVTGSPDVKWTPADIALIPPSKTQITIDQGFTGSPIANAIVRDVEPNAWTALHAIQDKPWTPARPTIYSDEVDSVSVVNDGWTGDFWLAFEFAAAPTHDLVIARFPHLKAVNLVGVQWKFTATHDESVVFDNTWPNAKAVDPVFVTITYPNIPGNWVPGSFRITPGINGHFHGEGVGGNGNVYTTDSVDGGKTWTPPVEK
jgi:hypothetical protein